MVLVGGIFLCEINVHYIYDYRLLCEIKSFKLDRTFGVTIMYVLL